jgi:hypothetical protein
MSHIIHEVLIRDGSGEMEHIRAHINCGTTGILLALRLGTELGVVDEPGYVTTLGLNGQEMADTSKSRKTAFTVQYMDPLTPVQESAVLVMRMLAYDLDVGLPWFQSRNPDVDWQHCPLLALRTPCGAELVAVGQVDIQECPGNVQGSTAREEACSEGASGIPDIQILGATAFDDLLASEQVVGTFVLRVGDCTGRLGVTIQGISDGE